MFGLIILRLMYSPFLAIPEENTYPGYTPRISLRRGFPRLKEQILIPPSSPFFFHFIQAARAGKKLIRKVAWNLKELVLKCGIIYKC